MRFVIGKKWRHEGRRGVGLERWGMSLRPRCADTAAALIALAAPFATIAALAAALTAAVTAACIVAINP